MLMPVAQGGHQLLVTKITISSNTLNYSLQADLQNNYGWDGSSPIEVELTINSGVYVYSTNASNAGLTANLVSGSLLTINNSGNIHGVGGSGGDGAQASSIPIQGGNGTAGTDAIKLLNVTATINNLSGGVIAGGGGGGGGAGNARGKTTNDAESGCTGQDRENGGGHGGAGAPHNSSASSVPNNTASGNGGTWGNAGGGGATGSTGGMASGCVQFQAGGGSGGAAGKAINVSTGASRTLNNSGTIYGATS